MNTEQLGSLVRTAVKMLLAYAVARGWLDQVMAGEITAAAVTLSLAGYGAYLRRDAGLLAVLASFGRSCVQAGVAFVVGVGWLDQQTAAEIGTGLMALAVTVYGLYARRSATLVDPAAKAT